MRKHPMLSLLLCGALLFCVFTAKTAATETPEAELSTANVTYPVEGGLLYFDATSGTIETCDKTVTSVDIPEAIYGIPVTHINTWAFENCRDLTSVTIPVSITRMDMSSFRGCVQLQHIVIPSSLTGLSSYLFEGCTSLTSVMIPDSVTTISNWAFDNCTSLTDVYYGGNLQQWLAVRVESGNDPLITANIHFESEIPTPSSEQVRINSITIFDEYGENPLNAIPEGPFLASVSVTSLSSLDNALVFFAAYSPNGQYLNMTYAFVEASPGATVRVTLPFDNTAGTIGQMRAFAVESFGRVPKSREMSE